jgi:hypothetical protein
VKFFDYNDDGRIDLYVTDMHSDMTTLQGKAGQKDFQPAFAKAKANNGAPPNGLRMLFARPPTIFSATPSTKTAAAESSRKFPTKLEPKLIGRGA